MHYLSFLDNLVRDFQYAFRSLRKERRFVGTAVFALALGIGAATVAFSAFYNLLFNAFAAKDTNRLVVLSVQNAESGGHPEMNLQPLAGSLSDLDAIRSGNQVFEEVIGYSRGFALLNGGKDKHQVYVGHVTGNAFEFYGVPPLLGRGIIPEDAEPGAPLVFAMSYREWLGEFGGDINLIGKSFLLDSEQRTLVGIMPQRFQAFGAMNQVWMAITDTRGASEAKNDEPSVNTMMARLKPGVKVDAASAELDVIVKRLAKNHPDEYPKHFKARVQSATDFLMGAWGIGTAGGPETENFDIKHMLYDLLTGVLLLLLIACSGVANLLLARGAAREKEIAVRTALGASRGRLVRQLLVESAVLAVIACAVGCVFAYFGMKAVAAAIPQKGQSVGGEAVIGLDATVLLFTVGVTALTTLLCGLAPALHAVGRDVQPMLTGSGRGAGDSRHGRFRAGLVVVEVALSIVLLAGAGLMIRSFYELTHIDLGFNAKNLFFAPLGIPWGYKGATEEQQNRAREIERRLKALPGVTEVAVNNSLPGYNPGLRFEATVPGASNSERIGFDGCSENLLRVFEMHMALGRWLSASEVDSAQPVAVINQTLAAHFFGGENPLGRQIEAKGYDGKLQPARDVYFQVIGVVRDAKNYGPQVPVLPMVFVPYTIRGGGLFYLKTKGDPALLMNPVRREMWAVNPDAIFSPQMGPYVDVFYGLTYSTHELGLTTFTGVAGIALVLVVIGVFSVMAYTVSLQTQEIGVRMALGAQQGEILRMVLRKGFALLVAGICLGLFASFGLTRFLASQIWGVSATDPWTFGAVVTLVVGVGLAACFLPARRATQVDPLVALRYE